MTIIDESQAAVHAVTVPSPPTELAPHNVPVYRVDGPRGERLLIAFGQIALPRWLEVVSAYYVSRDEPDPVGAADYDARLGEVTAALTRVGYYRVGYRPWESGAGFDLEWEGSGIVPVTYWRL